LDNRVIGQIAFEIGQIDHLFEAYASLIEAAQLNLIEATAMASVLHSFYNGIENLFLSIAKEIDHDVPASERWHRDLLTRMIEATSNRQPVVLRLN
jgi:hypothetical protein